MILRVHTQITVRLSRPWPGRGPNRASAAPTSPGRDRGSILFHLDGPKRKDLGGESGPLRALDHDAANGRVIPTDEDLIIARHTRRLIDEGADPGNDV
jgi:hypothetical protein